MTYEQERLKDPAEAAEEIINLRERVEALEWALKESISRINRLEDKTQ